MSNELTDVRCPCGDEYPADSYDAGFIAGSGMCQNCDAALPPKDICTCPSGDGSLAHPCPAHPTVEQAGGDERAAFEQWEAEQISFVLRQIGSMDTGDIDGDDVDLRFEDADGRDTGCDVSIVEYADKAANLIEAMLAERAALVQSFPTIATAPTYQFHSREIGESDWAPCDFSWYLYCSKSPEMDTRVVEVTAQPSPAQAEQAEAERTVVVARVVHSNPFVLDHCGPLNANDELMTVAQHAASVARWAEMFNRVEQERDAALARVAELESKLAELEMQAPVAFLYRGTDMGDQLTIIRLDHYWRPKYSTEEHDYIKGIPLYAAPVAQAQHSVPGDIMRDAQRYRWLRDQQFYFSFSTENSDAGISSCTAGMSSRFKNLSWVDAAIDSAIAAAPGKEVGHE
ncbi:TPA: hypothetical protein L4A65_000971 [Pseudomonas aeruginosa]|nr:hypothetical protein [Pseudomonas aeruginosa]